MRSPLLRFVIVLVLLFVFPAGIRTVSVHASPLPGSWRVLGAAATLPTLYKPMGLTVDSRGNVYVADSGNFRVVELGSHGQLLAHFGEADLRPGPGAAALPPGQEATGPRSLAVDNSGTAYVADSINRFVRVFSPQRHLVGDWPITVPGATVLQIAVALGGRGNLIVAIVARTRCTARLGPSYCATYYVIQRRSRTGAILGQFHSPIGISGQTPTTQSINQIATAVDSRGNIYVAIGGVTACYKDCSSFHFLIEHRPDGKVEARWGVEELGVSADWPALAIGGHGSIFVADDFNHRIDKRTAQGKVTARWSLGPLFPPLQTGPGGVAVDRQGAIYVVDPGSGRIVKLSSTGKLLAQWGAGGSGAGRFWSPGSVALDPQGRLWVNDATDSSIQMLGIDGRFRVRFKVAHVGPAMALDRQGNIYLAQLSGQVYHQVLHISTFSPSGTLRARSDALPSNVLALGAVELPSGIAVASNGDIFVAGGFCFSSDPKYRTPCGSDVVRLSAAGHVLGVFQISGESTGSGLAVDTQENIYIAYATTPRFEKWSRDGVLLASWGVPKPAYSMPSPQGVTLDSAGNIYFANTPQNFIEKFAPNGALLGTWGFTGSYAGQFHHPSGIAVDTVGTIYVADTDNHRIQKFST